MLWWKAAFALAFALLWTVPAHGQETAQPRLEKLAIHGNRAISKSAIKLLMNTRSSPWYAWLPGVEPRTFDPAAFRMDVERIKGRYRELGYYDVGVDTAIDRSRPGAVRVRMQVEEGPVVRVDRVRLVWLPDSSDVDSPGSVKDFETKSGGPLLKSGLEMDRDRLQDRLQNRGYAFAAVAVQVEVRREAHLSDVTFRATAGPLCRFGDVRVEGVRQVSERTVKRGVSFRKGRLYRKRTLLNSQQQLYRSGAFRSVVLGPPDSAAHASPVDVVVSVTERPPKSLKLGAGVATEEKVRVELAWQHRNFLGGARQLAFQSAVSFLEAGASVGLRQPYIWGNRTWLNANGYIRREDRLAFEVKRVGGAASLERNIRTVASLVFQVNTEFVDFRADSAFTQFSVAFQKDTRDDLFDPQSGLMASLKVEESGRFFRSDREFLKFSGEGRWYRRIGRGGVLALRVSGGVIRMLKGGGEIPDFKRFYAGGSNSVRGWSLNQLGPRDASGASIGGQSMLEGSVELRPRLFPVVGAALFLDGGNVGAHDGAFDAADFRWSAGAGLRYLSPIGPLRIDAAYRLSDDPFAKGRWRFYFSLGQAF